MIKFKLLEQENGKV